MRNIFAKKNSRNHLSFLFKMEHLSWFSFFLNFFIAKRNSRIDVIFVSCPLGISRMLLSIINDTTPHLAGKVYVTYQMYTHTKSGIGYISQESSMGISYFQIATLYLRRCFMFFTAYNCMHALYTNVQASPSVYMCLHWSEYLAQC